MLYIFSVNSKSARGRLTTKGSNGTKRHVLGNPRKQNAVPYFPFGLNREKCTALLPWPSGIASHLGPLAGDIRPVALDLGVVVLPQALPRVAGRGAALPKDALQPLRGGQLRRRGAGGAAVLIVSLCTGLGVAAGEVFRVD